MTYTRGSMDTLRMLFFLCMVITALEITDVQVTDLRCEYLRNPIGIDIKQPRFSWHLFSKSLRSLRQDSYRVLIGDHGIADGSVWDSTTVKSSVSSNVKYEGPPLRNGATYWWAIRVNVLGLDDVITSPTATFSMGLDLWNGHFIGMASDKSNNQSPWFRKKIHLNSSFLSESFSGMLYVASVGFHEAYINGQRVSEAVLSPSISYLPKRVLYRTYNVTHLLIPGDNAIGLWISSGWSKYGDLDHPFSKVPLVMADLYVNGAITVTTGIQWKCKASTTTHYGNWGKGGFGGDIVDDRLFINGWNTPHLDDKQWENATVYELPKGISLSADIMEPTVKHSIVPCINMTKDGDKRFKVEMKEVFTGWFEVLNMESVPNNKVTFHVSTTSGQLEEFSMQDHFIFGPSGKGNFEMRFSYHEIHYITIEGMEKAPAMKDIIGYRLTSNFTRTGHFNCSSPLITKIYETTINNYQGLTTGGMTVDCPHRERRGYGGDGHTSYQFALANFGVGAYFTKWARDWADVQSSDGYIPHTAPTIGGGGGPAWSGFAVTLPWQVYWNYNDTTLLASMYPTMVGLLEFFDNHTLTDGLLHPWTSSMWDFLGDWITPHGSESNVTSPENLLFNNCYLRYITSLTANISKVLGFSEAAATYQKKADNLSIAINEAFFNASTGVYIDMLQTHLVMPLATGVVPPSFEHVLMNNLEHSIRVLQNGHLDTGLTGTYFMTKVLTDMNRNDLIFIMTNQTTFPSYGYFLKQGYTTWPEDWKTTAAVSKIHGCYNAIGLWFIQGVLGISVEADSLYIRAGIESGDLDWAQGSRASIYGRVHSSWSISDNGFTHNITIPGNALAHVLIPGKSVGDVKESGVPVNTAKGVTVIGLQELELIYYVILEVESGHYQFTSTWTRPMLI